MECPISIFKFNIQFQIPQLPLKVLAANNLDL